MFKCLKGLAPVYLTDLCVGTAAVPGRSGLRSAARGDLGVYFDSHLTMKAHVARVARTCFLPSSSSTIVTTQSWMRCDCTCFSFSNLTTVTLCRLIYQHQRWHHSRESSTPLFDWFMIWDHVVSWHWLCMNFTGYQLQRESISNSAFWYTMQSLVEHRRIRLSLLGWKARSGCSRLVSSEREFSIAAPRAWSGLPVEIRLITDTELFKKNWKLKCLILPFTLFDNLILFVQGPC